MVPISLRKKWRPRARDLRERALDKALASPRSPPPTPPLHTQPSTLALGVHVGMADICQLFPVPPPGYLPQMDQKCKGALEEENG